MNKKKIASLLIAAALTIGVVGGSLAWFSSTDSINNKFNTQAGNPDPNNGLIVEEKFDKSEEYTHKDGVIDNLLPNVEVNKDVRVKNNATFAQFIRVKKITASFNNPDLNDSLILINLNKANVSVTPENGKWVADGDYYYYIGKVAPGANTNDILDSVKLSKEANNAYMNASFDVKVVAEGIQASGGAYADWGITAGSPVLAALKALE